MNGKGDTYRPVDRAKFDKNYDAIFRRGRNFETRYECQCATCGRTFHDANKRAVTCERCRDG